MAVDDVQPTAPGPSAPRDPQVLPVPPAPLRPENRASALEEIRERADTVWTHGSGGGSGARAGGAAGGGNGRVGSGALTVSGREDLKGRHGPVAAVDGCPTPFSQPPTAFN